MLMSPVIRLFDICTSFIGLIVAAPVMLLVAILVRVFLGSPVLFKQKRPGLNGEPFTLLKFRSMKDETDSSGKQLSDDIRLTKFGKILRSTSLDELPSLWNIFIGNMSLVGPRPLIMEYLPLYTPEQNRRHEVRPGLTGWAQVNGRNKLTFEERFELDVHYVDNRTFWLDMKIVLMTFRRVLVADGIAPEGKNTGEYFKGTPTE